jgi:hypothetical protein
MGGILVLAFAEPALNATAAGINADSILPLGAIVVGVAFGVVQAFSMTQEKFYTLQGEAMERRILDCEKHRDEERKQRDECRESLSLAHNRITELESKYEGGEHAGP